jgi:thiamine pyrophosphate-dependent acetolactate synthase large subunit-like protein
MVSVMQDGSYPRPRHYRLAAWRSHWYLTQQDVALDKLFIDVAIYNERIMSGAHMESVAGLAIRTAPALRRVAHITIPVNLQEQEVKKGRSERKPGPGSGWN